MKIIISLFFSIALFTSCKKCYDCTKECGYCTKTGALPVAGCEGDEGLQGFSVASWKVLLESQGYTCNYDNQEKEVCGKENKDNAEDKFFDCTTK